MPLTVFRHPSFEIRGVGAADTLAFLAGRCGGGLRGASFLRLKLAKLLPPCSCAALRGALFHRIADAPIAQEARDRREVGFAAFLDRVFERFNFRQFYCDFAAGIVRGFCPRDRRKATITLGCAPAQHQCRRDQRDRKSSHKFPPVDRVEFFCHKSSRSAKSEQGIGLPATNGAARARRPSGRGLFMVGHVVSTARCAVPLGGKTNHGMSGHHIGLWSRAISNGNCL